MIAKLPLPAGPVLVAGLGRAGEAALKLLSRIIGADALAVWDTLESGDVRARAERWRARGVRVILGGDGTGLLGALGRSATVVKSPGIDMDVPLLQMAAELGVEVIDEIEIGWRAATAPIVAVTGTNGKSTTCTLIASILSAAGRSVQVVGNTEFGPPLSTADLKAAIVCEVSSFQLQGTSTFLPEIAVFTNLTPEHLLRHGTMEAYGDAKTRMFIRDGRTCGTAVVNADDERGRRIIAAVQAAKGRIVSYGFSPDADTRIIDARWTMSEAEMMIGADGEIVKLQSRLPGRHNALNIAAAFAYGQAAGVDKEKILAGVSSAVAPPGRWELVDEGQPFDVIVDFAHTPDGIAQFLGAARAVTSSRGTALRTVFGYVGTPDLPKTRGCGEAAAALSDQLILTTGSLRSPRILRLRELRDAARCAGHVDIVLDRRRAIDHAIAAARPGDVVAILGLGALRRLLVDVAGTFCPCNDREAAQAALLSRTRCAS
jgi:UDP-N-acetylmuramoyl-L-alanyl-D-glutamate--2,6-diaminopimelate ligase